MQRITVRTLACGMPLIVETIPSARSVGVSWLLPAGFATEPADRLGLCAMWSELLLRGAGSLSSRAQADAFDGLGFTRSSDVISTHLSLGFAGLGSRLDEALPLIVDMVRRPRFDEEGVEPTRDLCLQALDSLPDDPQERAMLLLRELHLPPPFNRNDMGTREGLGAITRDDLVQRWLERARPEGSVLAVAGAANADQIAARLDALLGGWTGGAAEPAATAAPTRGRRHEHDETNQVHIAIAHEAPPERDDESMVERLIVGVLSGGMSGRLFTEVREKRSLCYSVYATYRAERDDGRIVAYAGTTPERAQQTLDVLWGELTRINGDAASGGGVTREEFERAAVGLKSKVVMSGESTGARAGSLTSDWRRLGRARSLEEIAGAIDAVTVERVNARLAARSPGTPTIVTLGPAELTSPV
ncbi:MAG: insulinase family protein [Phycisphaerales bacterium]|nr:MAG: insulinase family protein [Phycisphaerales bacterium]